jgi:Protein of unknown function (DUF4231)
VTARKPTGEARDLDDAVARLALDDPKKEALRRRYVGSVDWLERAARQAHLGHYALRIVAALAGVAVTALAGLNLESGDVGWAIFALGLLVAATLALDALLNLEARWLHYRAHSEELKSRLWQFVQLGGALEGERLERARQEFVAETERFLVGETQTYVKGVARSRPRDD